jgi:gamma-glutamylcyclotransferase (GGCT)/AIG2-like uncharacterized protein YtfP
MHEVFVYGTLKMGHHNNFFLTGERTRFLGTFLTEDTFDLYCEDDSIIPYLTRDLNPNREPAMVLGQVFEVSDFTMQELDQLEGNGFYYERERINIVGVPTMKPWAYLIKQPIPPAERIYSFTGDGKNKEGFPIISYEVPTAPVRRRHRVAVGA